MLLPPTYQIDHIIPWSLCHDDSECNLQALCANCHSEKTRKEAHRILQYKKLLNQCPDDCSLCWFCLETYITTSSHLCDRTLKDIRTLRKNQEKVMSSFEELCSKYKYIKKVGTSDHILHVKIVLINNTVIVDNVIVKFNEELFVSHIVEAIFLATRTKTKSRLYDNIIHFTIESGTNDDVDKQECISFLENSDIIEQLPPRIFKRQDENLIVLYL